MRRGREKTARYGVCGLRGEKKGREKRGRNESYYTGKTGREIERAELANMIEIERKEERRRAEITRYNIRTAECVSRCGYA